MRYGIAHPKQRRGGPPANKRSSEIAARPRNAIAGGTVFPSAGKRRPATACAVRPGTTRCDPMRSGTGDESGKTGKTGTRRTPAGTGEDGNPMRAMKAGKDRTPRHGGGNREKTETRGTAAFVSAEERTGQSPSAASRSERPLFLWRSIRCRLRSKRISGSERTRGAASETPRKRARRHRRETAIFR